MNKMIVIIPISVIVIIAALVGISSDSPERENHDVVFHASLADPNLYTDGIYTDTFTVERGEYSFRFVPNGSSPKILSITLNGENLEFYEDFKLKGISHQTEISEYFTWEYEGQKNIFVSEMQEVLIIINPNGNILGSVSVDILEN